MSLVLQYPYITPTSTVTLPNAVLGNAQQMSAPFQSLMTEDGYLKTYRKGIVKTKLIFTLDKVTKANLAELETFIDLSIGEDIKVTDHNSEVWQVKLTSNPINIIQNSDGVCGLHNIVLEFEGV